MTVQIWPVMTGSYPELRKQVKKMFENLQLVKLRYEEMGERLSDPSVLSGLSTILGMPVSV